MVSSKAYRPSRPSGLASYQLKETSCSSSQSWSGQCCPLRGGPRAPKEGTLASSRQRDSGGTQAGAAGRRRGGRGLAGHPRRARRRRASGIWGRRSRGSLPDECILSSATRRLPTQLPPAPSVTHVPSHVCLRVWPSPPGTAAWLGRVCPGHWCGTSTENQEHLAHSRSSANTPLGSKCTPILQIRTWGSQG